MCSWLHNIPLSTYKSYRNIIISITQFLSRVSDVSLWQKNNIVNSKLSQSAWEKFSFLIQRIKMFILSSYVLSEYKSDLNDSVIIMFYVSLWPHLENWIKYNSFRGWTTMKYWDSWVKGNKQVQPYDCTRLLPGGNFHISL